MVRIEIKPSIRVLLASLGVLLLSCLGTGWSRWPERNLSNWPWFYLIDLVGFGLGVVAIAGYRFRSRLVGAIVISIYAVAVWLALPNLIAVTACNLGYCT
jgi:hypothetical protein